jgi:hypothetical protein
MRRALLGQTPHSALKPLLSHSHHQARLSLSVRTDRPSALAPAPTPEEIARVESLIARYCDHSDESAFPEIARACGGLLAISSTASDALLQSDFLSRLSTVALDCDSLNEVFDCLSALVAFKSPFETPIVHLNLPSILINYFCQPAIPREEITASAFRLFAKLLEAGNSQLRRQCWILRSSIVAAIITGTRAFPVPLAFIVEPGLQALAAILRQDSPPLTAIQGFLDALIGMDLEPDVALLAFQFFRTLLESIKQTNFYASKPRVARILECVRNSSGELRSAAVRVIEYLTYCSELTSVILIEQGVVPAVIAVLQERTAVASCLHILANVVVADYEEVCDSGVFDFLNTTISEGSMAEMVASAFLLGNAMAVGAAKEWPGMIAPQFIAFLMTMLESADEKLAYAVLEGFVRVLSDGSGPSAELREALVQPEVGVRMAELAALTAETDHVVGLLRGLVGL